MENKPKFFAKVTQQIQDPGVFEKTVVGVFLGETQVGEYRRNYGFLDTFAWFTKGGKDYALYSKDYTATRIMELPSCRDLGGEESHHHGFCPVTFYVPSFIELEFTEESKVKGHRFRIYEPSAEEMEDTKLAKRLGGLQHEAFGFVAGCVWGDDNSWKIQYLDLSKADQGILVRDDRFGYIELPDNLKLRQAIRMGDGDSLIRIAHEQYFDRETGRRSYDSDVQELAALIKKAGLKKQEIDPKKKYTLEVDGLDYKKLLEIVGDEG